MAFTKLAQTFETRMPVVSTTKDMPTADVPPTFSSMWNMVGTPTPVGSAPGINGAALSHTGAQGELPVNNSGSGKDVRLVAIDALNRTNGMYILCDRLWHNSALNVTTITEQAITPAAIPARDINGTVSGEGVWAGLEFPTACTNVALINNTTIRFTDHAGNPNQVGNLTIPIPATANANSFIFFGNTTGTPLGVRSIEGITLGTSLVTGAIRLVLFRPLVMFHTASAAAHRTGGGQNALGLGAPIIPPNAVLFNLFNNAPNGAIQHSLHMTFAEA